MAAHPLVVVGDSLSQGFMSGAISRCDIAFPAWIADAMGIRDRFVVPDFSPHGGFPLNLERLLRRLSGRYGNAINWWEVVPGAAAVREMMDDVEDYWERGRGGWPLSRRENYHNLAIWGFEASDAYAVTEGVCRAAIEPPRDNVFRQVPEYAMYRTARRVLNSNFGGVAMEWTQVDAVEQLAMAGGIENLIIFLGANNALGTVTSLSIRHSEDQDLLRLPHERKCNLYLPQHFQQIFTTLADRLERIQAVERVFFATVPHVTVPPVTRGVSPDGTFDEGYFEYYTRPWIWDDVFDKDRHPHLTRSQARQIDSFIDAYNAMIGETVERHADWHLVDTCQLLDELAFRRNQGVPPFKWPTGLVRVLKKELKYLVEGRSTVLLDTRYLRGDPANDARLEKGGLFSLDGIHPTTIGYGLLADFFITHMKQAGVTFASDVDWQAVIRADTLVGKPPALLANLRETLSFLDRRGLFSAVFEQFG